MNVGWAGHSPADSTPSIAGAAGMHTSPATGDGATVGVAVAAATVAVAGGVHVTVTEGMGVHVGVAVATATVGMGVHVTVGGGGDVGLGVGGVGGVAVGEPGNGQWVVEMQIDAVAELGALSDPFGLMAQVLYTGDLASYPSTASSSQANTWQDIDLSLIHISEPTRPY